MTATRNTAASATGVEGFELTAQQVAFFQTFGFLTLPGLFARDIARIDAGFEAVFAQETPIVMSPDNEFHRARDPRYAELTREFIPAFIDQSPDLVWIRDDPRVVAIATALLGPGYAYAESDGNLFNCDVYWHLDAYGALAELQHIKLFFYLEPLGHDTGALRVMPGTHRAESTYARKLRKHLTLRPDRVSEIYAVPIEEIPSWTLGVEPGDVVVGDFQTLHATFGGSVRRRLFTVNFRAHDRLGDPTPP